MSIFPDPHSEQAPQPRGQGSEPSDSESDPEPGQLLDQVLNPLLEDFEDTFARGLHLLGYCPDRVLPQDRRFALEERLSEAQAALGAARALRAASSTPMALDMAVIQPWHALVVEVWSLSSAMRLAGVVEPASTEREGGSMRPQA